MTPPMHRRVRNVFVESGLTAGYIVQSLSWNDTGKASDRFIVFRPNGGTPVDRDMAADYYVMVDVISKGKASADYAQSENDAQAIIDYVQQKPDDAHLPWQISNMGGIPSPVITAEGVWCGACSSPASLADNTKSNQVRSPGAAFFI
ncbi:Uncharacterised protein [Klebsiella pneumoniae]|nr:Uncharacterised protein [Klebsiella pneumoniae]